MEVVLKDSIFSDVTLLDDAYFSFMQANRTDLVTSVASQSSKFCFNFTKDEVFSPEDQARFKWEAGKGETVEEPGFVFAGRASLASMDTLATFPTSEFDRDGEIPEIQFAKVGRTSLTNEEFVNDFSTRMHEDDTEEGSASRVPFAHQTTHTPGGLPFGRQV